MYEFLLMYDRNSPGLISDYFLFIILFALPFLHLMHFICDFMMQTDDIAKAKSESNVVLTKHITLYSLPFFLIVGPVFGAITFAAHWITDYLSSRSAKAAFARGDRHHFFVVIGFDQLMHNWQLYFTFLLVTWLYV